MMPAVAARKTISIRRLEAALKKIGKRAEALMEAG
jgi:hypothetical protein